MPSFDDRPTWNTRPVAVGSARSSTSVPFDWATLNVTVSASAASTPVNTLPASVTS